jgi:5,5'-dehydrodivanillate O-demethylase oxygenase subunit
MLSVEENRQLTQVGAGTPMGELLRRYWMPFAGASELEKNPTKAVRLLGEDLVAYRDLGGAYGLIDRHCSHRRADLTYGFVEKCRLRCNYHGWVTTSDGSVSEIPFDDLTQPSSKLKDGVKARAYPVREAGGLLFAYMGPAPAPELPNYEAFTRKDGFCEVVFSELPCNWLQCQENSIDPVHFEWMHDNWSQRLAGSHKYAGRHLRVAFDEVEHGFIYRRLCEGHDLNGELWTTGRLVLWPLGFFLGDQFEWRIPIDDENTLNLCWFYSRPPKDVGVYDQKSVPTWNSPIKDERGQWITSHVINQDIVAWIGQGTIADRTKEYLSASDRGIIMTRKRYFQEMKEVAEGKDPKGVIRDPEKAACIDLPIAGRTKSSGELTLAEWNAHPFLKARVYDHRHCAGQPEHVRKEYVQAMGFDLVSKGL